jgi:thiol-disulfide isomerase/thioredoxin
MIEPTRSAKTRRSTLMLVLSAAVATGCSKTASRPAPDRDNVSVRVVDRAAYDALLADKRGQIVLVDFWAHWCEPCVANFPHVMELAQRDWDRGLAVVTVNMDAPEAAEKTIAFLKEQRAGAADNLISQFGGGSKSMDFFEIPDGALPCYKLYDRKGQLRHTFALDPAAQKQFTLQEIDAAIEQLMLE